MIRSEIIERISWKLYKWKKIFDLLRDRKLKELFY